MTVFFLNISSEEFFYHRFFASAFRFFFRFGEKFVPLEIIMTLLSLILKFWVKYLRYIFSESFNFFFCWKGKWVEGLLRGPHFSKKLFTFQDKLLKVIVFDWNFHRPLPPSPRPLVRGEFAKKKSCKLFQKNTRRQKKSYKLKALEKVWNEIARFFLLSLLFFMFHFQTFGSISLFFFLLPFRVFLLKRLLVDFTKSWTDLSEKLHFDVISISMT